ncbi:MAG: phosphonate ABC transporter ATP-binding protein [Burkholderiaceae bacterium]
MSNAVEIRNLNKTFVSGRKALDDVSLTIAEGEMVALIGASGSGKSTLLRHLPGFVVADSGDVIVGGRTMQSGGKVARGIRRERSRVGFVFQQFNLVGRLPVITNVLIGLLHRTEWWRRLLMRFSIQERREAIRALSAVGIAETAWQRASTLSGGQQQRAAIARCLVQQARLILADEPIASLDPEASRKVMELLAGIHRDHGRTVLVSLHQVEFAMRYCPRTIALRAGRVVYDGPSAALTPQLLGELYGTEAHELFGSLGANAQRAPALGSDTALMAA